MKRLGLVAVLAAVALTVAGCGQSSSTPSGGADHGGTINYVTRYAVPGGFDFLTNHDFGLPGYVAPAYSKLVKFQTGPDIKGVEVGPDLAKSWDISADGLTYTFHLDPAAHFQKIAPVDGRAVTAKDVIASFQAIVADKANSAYMFDVVDSMTAPDDHTFVMKLKKPMSPMLENLAIDPNFIVPAEGIEGKYDMSKTIIGSGAFLAGQIDPQTVWHYTRNPNYFHKDKPKIDKLNILVVLDPSASLAALKTGQVNLTPVEQQTDVDALVKTGKFKTVSQLFGPEMLYLNPAVKPFNDIRVRKAIAMAIDWDKMGKSIRGTYSLTSVIPPEFGGMTSDELRKVRPYDPAQAKKLLAEAGYPNGFSAEFLAQDFFSGDLEAQWIVEDLKKVGINLTIAQVDTATYNNRERAGEFGILRGLRTVVTTDQYMQDMACGSPTNFTKTCDPKVDDLIAQYRAELDPTKQKAIAKEFTEYWEQNVLTVVAGPMTYYNWVWSTSVDNNYTSSQALSGNVFGYGTWFEELSVTK